MEPSATKWGHPLLTRAELLSGRPITDIRAQAADEDIRLLIAQMTVANEERSAGPQAHLRTTARRARWSVSPAASMKRRAPPNEWLKTALCGATTQPCHRRTKASGRWRRGRITCSLFQRLTGSSGPRRKPLSAIHTVAR